MGLLSRRQVCHPSCLPHLLADAHSGLLSRFSALFLGRTIGIHEGDFSTPLLDVPTVPTLIDLQIPTVLTVMVQDDMDQMWEPCVPDPLYGRFSPVPAAHMSYFRHLSMLCGYGPFAALHDACPFRTHR